MPRGHILVAIAGLRITNGIVFGTATEVVVAANSIFVVAATPEEAVGADFKDAATSLIGFTVSPVVALDEGAWGGGRRRRGRGRRGR